jgi:hypothetical protein
MDMCIIDYHVSSLSFFVKCAPANETPTRLVAPENSAWQSSVSNIDIRGLDGGYLFFCFVNQWAGRAVDADLTMLLDEGDRTLYSYGEHVYEIPRIVAIRTTFDAVCAPLPATKAQTIHRSSSCTYFRACCEFLKHSCLLIMEGRGVYDIILPLPCPKQRHVRLVATC